MLAEKTGYKVSYIRDEMSLDEFSEWAAYFTLKNEAEKKAIEKANHANR